MASLEECQESAFIKAETRMREKLIADGLKKVKKLPTSKAGRRAALRQMVGEPGGRSRRQGLHGRQEAQGYA